MPLPRVVPDSQAGPVAMSTSLATTVNKAAITRFIATPATATRSSSLRLFLKLYGFICTG